MKKNKNIAIIFISVLIFLTVCYCEPVNVYNDDKSKKIVYLTFDDGPTYKVTDEILDILKEHNIKATFFIVGKEIKGKENILKRIFKEGHGIGAHTYSHNFKKIYSSNEIFIDEMITTRKKIKEVTGYSPNILRFPGGSYKRLNNNLLKKLHENNFKVFDWNVDLRDGVNPTLSPKKLLANSKKYNDNYTRLIVLMHCNFANKNTVKALPSIIKYYKNLGYEFKPITKDTKEYHYKININDL